jgi:hypothetical protein
VLLFVQVSLWGNAETSVPPASLRLIRPTPRNSLSRSRPTAALAFVETRATAPEPSDRRNNDDASRTIPAV